MIVLVHGQDLALRALPSAVNSLDVGTIGHHSVRLGRHVEYVLEEGGILDRRHTWLQLD